MLNHLLKSVPTRPNLIINDSQGKLLSHMYQNLQQQHYNIKFLSPSSAEKSNYYNPLALVTYEAVYDNFGYASQILDNVSSIIFNNRNAGKNAFFYGCAGNLFDSITFNLIAHAYHDYHDSNSRFYHNEKVWDKVNIPNVINVAVKLGGFKTVQNGNGLNNYFEMLQKKLNSIPKEKIKYNTYYQLLKQSVVEFCGFKIAGIKTECDTYSTFLDCLRIFQQPSIARLVSHNDFNINKLLFNKLLILKFSEKQEFNNVSVRIYDRYHHTEFYKKQLINNTNLEVPINDNVKLLSVYDYLLVKVTVHNEHHNISKTSKFKRNPNDSISMIKNNAHVLKASFIYDKQPKTIFLNSVSNHTKLNKINTMFINQVACHFMKNSTIHCYNQAHLSFILDHTETLSTLSYNLPLILSHCNNAKNMDISLVIPNQSYFECNSNFSSKDSEVIDKNCPYKVDMHHHGYILSTSLFNPIGLLSDLYDDSKFYPERVWSKTKVLLNVPKNFDYKSSYDSLQKFYTKHNSIQKNTNLILTNKYLLVSSVDNNECRWGKVVNASNVTKQKLENKIYSSTHTILTKSPIYVLFNLNDAIIYQHNLILPINKVIAVK